MEKLIVGGVLDLTDELFGAHHLGKQVMIAIPVTLVVQRNEEEVAPL